MVEPVYRRLAKMLEEAMDNGQYKPGERLPSERILAQQFSVSRMTARQALKYLEEMQRVYREEGSGTYVKTPAFAQHNVGSFTETIGSLGYKVSTQVLEVDFIYGLDSVAQTLELSKETIFLKIKRLRFGDRIPMALETLYIPKHYCPMLEEKDLTLSLYRLLEEAYDIRVKKNSYTMEAKIANPYYAKIFGLNKTTALLKVSGVTVDQKERKLFYEESVYRSDLYHYKIDIM